MTKTCSIPGCVEPRKIGKGGHVYPMCHDHFIEYWRRAKSGDWDGWQGNRRSEQRKSDKTICCAPDCNEPRMVNAGGKTLTLCEEHQREYWRSQKPPTGVGRGNGKKAAGKRTSKAKALEVEIAPPPREPGQIKLRIVALRCDVCGVKLPYTSEHFDIDGKSRTCRHCADARVVTVVNPLTNTATRLRVIGGDKIVECGEGAEAYAAFARAEQAAGHTVLITW